MNCACSFKRFASSIADAFERGTSQDQVGHMKSKEKQSWNHNCDGDAPEMGTLLLLLLPTAFPVQCQGPISYLNSSTLPGLHHPYGLGYSNPYPPLPYSTSVSWVYRRILGKENHAISKYAVVITQINVDTKCFLSRKSFSSARLYS